MVAEETEKSIARLQMLEQNLQMLASQRQSCQLQISEIENAVKELNKTKEQAFKIIGNLMIASNPKELEKELESKKEVLTIRITSLEKQETQLRKKAEELQKEVMSSLQNKKGGA